MKNVPISVSECYSFICSLQPCIELPAAVVGGVLSAGDLKTNRRRFFTAVSALPTPAACAALSGPPLVCVHFLVCEA